MDADETDDVKPQLPSSPIDNKSLTSKAEKVNGGNSPKLQSKSEPDDSTAENGTNITKEESNYDEEDDGEVEDSEEAVEITHTDVTLLHQEPLYAEICSFFNIFSSLLTIKPVSFTKIEKIFSTFYDGGVDRELIDLHIMLMRKIYLKFAKVEKWESALQKFCLSCPILEAESQQLERRGYTDLGLTTRLTILKALCESQFDYNIKFKEYIFNTYQTNELRLAPIGSDKNGLSYFYQQDCELNIRLYTVEPDDMSDGTWALVAKSEQELVQIIVALKNPDFGIESGKKDDEDEDIDEDQLLGENTKSNGKFEAKNASDKSADNKQDTTIVKLSEAEMTSIALFSKRFIFWDLFRDATVINQKKLAKEERKKERANKTADIGKADKTKTYKDENVVDEQQNETEEEATVETVEDDDRRVLPRRSAKSNAITNLRALGALPKKSQRTTPPKKSTEKEKIDKKIFVETLPHFSDEFDSEEDEDEEDEEYDDDINSSDDDFTLDGRPTNAFNSNRVPPTKRKKAAVRRRAAGRPPAAALVPRGRNATKQSSITFISSDEDEAEPEEELKERKKATEKTLCMNCQSSKRPDLLLLCDMCDDAWHTWCLKPQLWYVPDGDWFCPKCHHVMLIQKLSYACVKLREAIKQKQTEDKKKQLAADRLKREMEYIGVSLNNIIPNSKRPAKIAVSSSSSELDEDDEYEEHLRMRKSKKRAIKKVMGSKRKAVVKNYVPIVTIAEGRSRRTTTKVDYNFQAYEEQLQVDLAQNYREAMGSSATKEHTPPSGLGRGKDMSTIYEAERKRQAEADSKNNGDESAAEERLAGAQPPTKRKAKPSKKRHRLTDMDVDNESSDSDEYKEEDDVAISEDPEPSEDEYLPREFQRSRRTRRGGFTKSDDEFIDDNSSSEYETSTRKRKNQKSGGGRSGKAKRRKRYSESDESSDESFHSDSSASGDRERQPVKSKWPPKASTSEEEDEEELEMPSDSAEERTEAGRPLRRAAAEMQKKVKAIEENVDDEENESEEEEKTVNDEAKIDKSNRSVGALTRPHRPKNDKSDDEPEFQPDEEESEEEDEDEDFNEDNHKSPRPDNIREKPKSERKSNRTKVDSVKSGPTIVSKTSEKTTALKPKDGKILSSTLSTSSDQKEPTDAPTSAAELSKKPSPRKSRLSVGIRKQASSSSINSNSVAETPVLPAIVLPPNVVSSVAESTSAVAPVFTVPLSSASTSISSMASVVQATPPVVIPPTISQPTFRPLVPTSVHPIMAMPSQPLPPQSIYGGVPPPSVFYAMHQAGKFPPPPQAFVHHPPPPEYYAQYAQSQPHYMYQHLPIFSSTIPSQSTDQQQQMVIDPRTGQFVESESLGHALADAMNPEDL